MINFYLTLFLGLEIEETGQKYPKEHKRLKAQRRHHLSRPSRSCALHCPINDRECAPRSVDARVSAIERVLPTLSAPRLRSLHQHDCTTRGPRAADLHQSGASNWWKSGSQILPNRFSLAISPPINSATCPPIPKPPITR